MMRGGTGRPDIRSARHEGANSMTTMNDLIWYMTDAVWWGTQDGGGYIGYGGNYLGWFSHNGHSAIGNLLYGCGIGYGSGTTRGDGKLGC